MWVLATRSWIIHGRIVDYPRANSRLIAKPTGRKTGPLDPPASAPSTPRVPCPCATNPPSGVLQVSRAAPRQGPAPTTRHAGGAMKRAIVFLALAGTGTAGWALAGAAGQGTGLSGPAVAVEGRPGAPVRDVV